MQQITMTVELRCPVQGCDIDEKFSFAPGRVESAGDELARLLTEKGWTKDDATGEWVCELCMGHSAAMNWSSP